MGQRKGQRKSGEKEREGGGKGGWREEDSWTDLFRHGILFQAVINDNNESSAV